MGGVALKLYENSLSLAFLTLFVFSFTMHAVGRCEGLQPGATRARRGASLGRRVRRHLALLVRVAAKLTERVRGGRGPGGALDLPAAEGLFPIKACCPPARRDGGMRASSTCVRDEHQVHRTG